MNSNKAHPTIKHSPNHNNLHFILPSLDTGGGEIAFTQIANTLSKRKYSIAFHLLINRGDLQSRLSNSISFQPLTQSKKSFPGILFSLFSLIYVIKNNPNDIYISTLTGTNLLLLIAKLLAGGKAKTIIVEASTKANRPSLAITWLMKYFYPKANVVISVSEDVNKDLISRIGKHIDASRMTIVPNPVDIKKSLQKREKSPLTYQKSNHHISLLAVGRLTEAKGYELLIRAFAKANTSNAAKLTIVGGGELDSTLKGLTHSLGQENNVFFTGNVDDPYPYFDSADIFVLSSLWEGLPLVLLEAMAMKIPRIILSDCPGSMSEKLSPLHCVDIFSSGSIESLSHSIKDSISHQTYKKSDYSSFLNPYFLENVVDQYEDIICQHIAEHANI